MLIPAKTLLLLPLLVCSVAAVTMECSGSTSSNCRGKQCTVICSDGNKVDLFCEEGGVSITSTNNFSGGKSSVDAQCGKKIKFKACFPFCGSETPFSSETQHLLCQNHKAHQEHHLLLSQSQKAHQKQHPSKNLILNHHQS